MYKKQKYFLEKVIQKEKVKKVQKSFVKQLSVLPVQEFPFPKCLPFVFVVSKILTN